MFAVIEHHFEQPIVAQRQIFAAFPWRAIVVLDVFQVALRELPRDEPISLMWGRPVDIGVVLRLAGRIGRIGDPGVIALAVDRGDIVLGD